MSEVKVTVRNNGPLRVEGGFALVDHDRHPFGLGGRTMVVLCRCGLSSDKPFGDGAHKSASFQSVCPARDLTPLAAKP